MEKTGEHAPTCMLSYPSPIGIDGAVWIYPHDADVAFSHFHLQEDQ